MLEYEIFGLNSHRESLQQVVECLLSTYAAGETSAYIYSDDQSVVDLIQRHSPGLARRFRTKIWRFSTGIYQNILVY